MSDIDKDLQRRLQAFTDQISPEPSRSAVVVRKARGKRRLVAVSAGLAVLVAVGGLAGAATLLGGRDGIKPAPGPDATTLELQVLNDFGVEAIVPDTVLSGVTSPSIDVGRRRAAILAIERPQVSADCLVAAQLRLYMEDASDNAAEQLAIYPSQVFNAADKQDGDRYGYLGTSLDNRPRSMAEDLAPGWSVWDVTDTARLWLSRRPFPSLGKRAPRQGPIVLALRDVEGAKPFGTATFTSSDGAVNRPHLVVRQRPDCPEKSEPDERRFGDGDDFAGLLEDTIEAQGGTIRLQVVPETIGGGKVTEIRLVNETEAPIGYGHEYILERQTPNGWRPVHSPTNCVFTQELIFIAPGDQISHPIGPYDRACSVLPIGPGEYRVSKTVELESGDGVPLTVSFSVASRDSEIAPIRPFVRVFMAARVDGAGAEEFLHRGTWTEAGPPGRPRPLYPDPPPQDFRIEFVDDLGEGSFEVGVSLVFKEGTAGETLFVRMRQGSLVILGAREGLTGP